MKLSPARFSFQHQLALYSGNTLLPILFTSFKSLTRTLWLRFCMLYGIPALYRNTDELCRKLEQRDFEGAIRCLSVTVQDSINGQKKIYY